jgi:hypothetical protein
MIWSCGLGAILARALFAAWGYAHGGLAPSAYLDAATAALAIIVRLFGEIDPRARRSYNDGR